jgi:hypothetical protein
MSASTFIEALAEDQRRGFEELRQERHKSFNAPFRAHTDLYSGTEVDILSCYAIGFITG